MIGIWILLAVVILTLIGVIIYETYTSLNPVEGSYDKTEHILTVTFTTRSGKLIVKKYYREVHGEWYFYPTYSRCNSDLSRDLSSFHLRIIHQLPIVEPKK